jgi:hypothetical protein
MQTPVGQLSGVTQHAHSVIYAVWDILLLVIEASDGLPRLCKLLSRSSSVVLAAFKCAPVQLPDQVPSTS